MANCGRARDQGVRRPGVRSVRVGAHQCSALRCYPWRGRD